MGNAVFPKLTVISVMIQLLGGSDQHIRKENTLAPCPGNGRVRLRSEMRGVRTEIFRMIFGVVRQAALVSLSLALTGRV